MKRPRERYVLTVFCYGSNLGPVQTARSVRGTDRFKLAFINQRHVTEAGLNDAITTVVNAYAQFPLQRLWGTGKSASADGMKWDLYPQNLMSEYHIHYGGYGGIGYYLLADSYIALVSRFTACGSWEGQLYFALRELGRVVRTMFLLRYISDLELRHTIQTATTKSERFNRFVQWVSFGGDSVIAENVRDEQRKFIKYNHLVANLLVFHNLVTMTRAIGRMETNGHQISDEILAVLSPYQTSHINRFGSYSLNFGRDPEAVHLHFRKSPQSEPSPKVGSMPVSKADLA